MLDMLMDILKYIEIYVNNCWLAFLIRGAISILLVWHFQLIGRLCIVGHIYIILLAIGISLILYHIVRLSYLPMAIPSVVAIGFFLHGSYQQTNIPVFFVGCWLLHYAVGHTATQLVIPL